mmetsp:Transcript_58217/g.131889  ORF Transcript_58217/g.131889 Transcript_58217/m.131889 type:complete len:229 (-) Transcript_58217:211-897(-)
MVLNRLVEEGERPLLILPRKYLDSESVPNYCAAQFMPKGSSTRRAISDDELALRKSWSDRGIVSTPRFHWSDDDHFWMFASVAERPELPVGEPKASVVTVVTNDEARDHRLAVDARAFMRWQSSQVRNFEFTGSIDETPTLHIAARAPYSSEAQPPEYESLGSACGVGHWHIPIKPSTTASAEEKKLVSDWACVSIPLGREGTGSSGHTKGADKTPDSAISDLLGALR